jgi:copper homeostasis protein
MPIMSRPLLEVIALDAEDARAAHRGGADRVELVSDMGRAGLSPAPETVAAVRAAVDLPVRTMLRHDAGFAAGDLTALRRTARVLRAAGADEFVLGFLDDRGTVDMRAVEAVLEVLDGCPWTFHRAIDHTPDRRAAWSAIVGLPGLDCVLTSGCPDGVGAGMDTLLADAAAGHGVRLLAGGGLREHHLPALLAGGVAAFHTGGAVRPGGAWDAPVDAELVRRWRARL